MRYIIALCLMAIVSALIGCADNGNAPDPEPNNSPEITSPSMATAIKDSLFTYTASATDPDGDSVEISFSNYPSWLSVPDSNLTGLTPWGAMDTSFTVVASDGRATVSQNVLLTVEGSEVFYVGLRPRENAINSGENQTLTLGINSVEDLFSITMILGYDTLVVQLDSITVSDGSLLNNGALCYFNWSNWGAEIGAGNIQTVEDDDVSGSGTLLDLHFTGIGSGTAEISLYMVMILDESGNENADLENLITKGANITVE